MKLWLKKIAVILVAILTLGIYIPPTLLNTDAEKKEEVVTPKTDMNDAVLTSDTYAAEQELLDNPFDLGNDPASNNYINTITAKAKEQALTKLGPKITGQVEDDFETDILPNMESVLELILKDAGETNTPYLAITEQPSQGFGEKMFNIYDYRTNKDVARFHVRRDNRPLEGYWFNFHYHLGNDNFEKHHEIGEIYWDKNTPPRWMA
jgi:hypothetical protein